MQCPQIRKYRHRGLSIPNETRQKLCYISEFYDNVLSQDYKPPSSSVRVAKIKIIVEHISNFVSNIRLIPHSLYRARQIPILNSRHDFGPCTCRVIRTFAGNDQILSYFSLTTKQYTETLHVIALR